jgi:putative colanic acid biosysnthesis UDP-glucose lipid carrier transferase
VAAGLKSQYEDVVDAVQRAVDVALIVAVHVVIAHAYGVAWHRESATSTLLGIVVFMIAGEVMGLYRSWRSERIRTEARVLFSTWMATVVALLLVGVATKTTTNYSRVVSFGWFLAAPMVLLCWRIALRSIMRSQRAHGRNLRSVAILGATRSAEDLCKRIRMRPWLGMRILGVYDDRRAERQHQFTDKPWPHIGREADLIEACRKNEIDVVYIALPLRAEVRIAKLVRALADTTATVYLVADFFTYDLLCARWSSIGDFPLVSLHDTPFSGAAGWIKRVEDIILSSAILALIALPLLAISILVKATSRGPVLFRQKRYGLNGKEIRVLKFRSMTVCEDGPVIKQATKNDARFTAVGKILRRTSLDELPQFLQVLTGEMSIVGPRPHAVAHNEQYRSLIHGYMLRHKVKPGITGWAQVNGWRGETPELSSMEKRVAHDLEYIEKWTLLWDLEIILRTIAGQKKSRNAY